MNRPRSLLFALGLAFSYFVFVKVADWLLEGFTVNTFGPRTGVWIHAGIFSIALLGYVAWGVLRLRDRFSVLVGAAVLAVPIAVYLATAW